MEGMKRVLRADSRSVDHRNVLESLGNGMMRQLIFVRTFRMNEISNIPDNEGVRLKAIANLHELARLRIR